MKYLIQFKGRKNGAIGIHYPITARYDAESVKQAWTMLYSEYENVQPGALTYRIDNGKKLAHIGIPA